MIINVKTYCYEYTIRWNRTCTDEHVHRTPGKFHASAHRGSSLSVPTACDLPEECLPPRLDKPDGGQGNPLSNTTCLMLLVSHRLSSNMADEIAN